MSAPPKNRPQKLLTKSKYIQGLKCPAYLWLEFNAPEEIPPFSEATLHRFDEGHKIGNLAKTLYPEGLSVPEEDFVENLQQSQKLLSQRKPLFEAAFIYNDCYARADILEPVEEGKWDIIEVKSGASVKEDHYFDSAFQKYVYEGAGLKIRKCFIMHINNKYVRKGEIEINKLFTKTEVTEEVNALADTTKENIKEMFKIITSKKRPEMKAKHYCCGGEWHKSDRFWKENPECNILDMYGGRGKELFNLGILRMKDVPDDYKLNEKQSIQKECDQTGKIHANKDKILTFLSELKYPLYFIDFETYDTGIPIHEGTRPYQKIPFQFSLHVAEKKGPWTKHYSFIAEGREDPREKVLIALKKTLGDKGTIVAYNANFEKEVIRKLGEEFPKYKKWAESALKRFVDLIVPFRSFYYYDPKQEGSASLKAVLPALTGRSYENLEIAEGGAASVEYLNVIYGEKVTKEERERVFRNLEEYCSLDTEGMVLIVEKLGEMVG